MVNILLQAGLYFQRAAAVENVAVISMADQKLAMKMYLIALGVGRHATPEVELSTYLSGLHNITLFQFQDTSLNEIIPALQKRASIIIDVFPFLDVCKSNVSLFEQGDTVIKLMRHLLQALVSIIEYNKSADIKISMDHDIVTVYYQGYEACLKNWYEDAHSKETEQKFRLNLMEALLNEKGWNFLEIEENIAYPWALVSQDNEGWRTPIRSLPFPETSAFKIFSSLDGVEIDYATGEITFLLQPWNPQDGDHHKIFIFYDLQQMLEKNIGAAIFSLDPPDSNKPYHPFNTMRFSPSRLYQTELLNTMLLTDYILKFLTVNQEVQGIYPHQTRPIDQMIKHLPLYLRNIIYDFHREQHSGALHRFWIEAEEIDVFEEKKVSENIEKLIFGESKMIVKKHRMERDIDGNLTDTDKDDEGWAIYILTLTQKNAWQKNEIKIQGHAIVFNISENKAYFLENSQIHASLELKGYNEMLNRLYHQTRQQDGKVEISQSNTHLIFRLTKELTHQVGLSDRYSPEFVFAHEFTRHYNEFALYFPEFARLRELSKMTVLSRLMSSIRKANNESLSAMNYLLSDHSAPEPASEVYTRYKTSQNKSRQSIQTQFWNWSHELVYGKLMAKWQTKLTDIMNGFGTFTFTVYSPEVEQECQARYKQIEDEVISKHGYSVWNNESSKIYSEIIAPQKSKIAETISKIKQSHCREQLKKAFLPSLSSLSSYAVDGLMDSFIAGDIKPLAMALARSEQKKAIKDIQKNLSSAITESEIESALNQSTSAISRIATDEINCQFRKESDSKKRLEAGFSQIGFGKDDQEVTLEDKCFWVPASVRHEYDALHSRQSFFVYGGVNLQAKVNYGNGNGGQGTINPPSGRYNGGSGGGSGFGGGGSGGTGRFTQLLSGASKAEATAFLTSGNHNLPAEQAKKIAVKIKNVGQTSSINIKVANATGEARLAAERAGHDGFQRMSFGINVQGKTNIIVQTAFHSDGSLVHQKPGQSKNNIYDVKFPTRL